MAGGARSLWNGTIVFGAVAVPVKLHTAIDSGGVHFYEVHLEDGSRIEHRRFCSKEDREVPYEVIGNGDDLDGKQVVLTDDELGGLAPERTQPSPAPDLMEALRKTLEEIA